MKGLLAALALAVAPLTAAQAMAAPVVAAAAKPLDQLVALLLPQESLLKLGGRAFDTGVRSHVATNPELRAMQARHPGLSAHVATQLRPAFLKAMKKELPALRREIRAVVSDGLSASEIAEARTFFASPAGAKLRTQIYATMAEKPDQPPEAIQAAVMRGVMKTLKAAEYPSLIAFGASSAAGKMTMINPRIAAASKAWSDRLVARYGKRMRSLAAAAAKRYLKGRS